MQARIIKFTTSKPVLKQKKPVSRFTSLGYVKPTSADAIRDNTQYEAIKAKLLAGGRYGMRNYMIFLFGTNLGRRCGDILNLRAKQVAVINDTTVRVLNRITLVEEKTGKTKTVFVKPALAEAIRQYIRQEHLAPDDYLFRSRKHNTNTGGRLGTRSFNKILAGIREDLALDFHLSTHSMRKTFGYRVFQAKGLDMASICLGHESTAVTRRYIGLTQQDEQDVFESLPL